MRVINGALQVPPPDDQERLIAMLISEAQSQRALQATTWDGYESKALSLMAVPLAGVAALVAMRPGRIWLVAVLLLAASVVPLLLAAWIQEFVEGPDLAKVYLQNIDWPGQPRPRRDEGQK